MQRAVFLAGFSLYNGRLRDALSQCSIFHFNWYETPSGKLNFLKKLAVLSFLKRSGKKIVFTLHNKTNHLSENRTPERKILQNWFIRNSASIVIHCRDSIKFLESLYSDLDMSKVVYVPHPNYINAYPDVMKYSGLRKQPGDVVLLFVGSVIPHKNIDVIIRMANQLKEIKRLRFLICGRGKKEYCGQLKAMIADKNITADFRFIDDGEIPSLLSMCDAVLLPYSTVSELNSGASYLAFSYGKPVIGTWTGTTRDIDPNLVYCYGDTGDKDEHTAKLKDAVLRFYRDFTENHEAVRRKGEVLRELMANEHSLERTAEALHEAYGVLE